MRKAVAYLSTLCALTALVLGTGATARDRRPDHDRDGKPVRLFNGKDLSGWAPVLEDPTAKPEDVWSVDAHHGVLSCTGKPTGYLRTVGDYTNYVLRLQWRFVPPVPKDGGSGVLL